MLTWKDVVAIAKDLPEVEVSKWYGTPGLKVGKKGFVRHRTEAEGGLVVLCSPEDKARLLASGDPAYFTEKHYDGYPAILLDLKHITPEALRERLTVSWRLNATPKILAGADRVCFHCKAQLTPGVAHDCWTTTERALTKDLSEDLQDAWERLRETAAEFGEQRIYASHHSIMFARKACYFFVRPQKKYLEVCIFLGRVLRAPQILKTGESSKTKRYNILRVVHRDQVEPPITDWLKEAYDVTDTLGAKGPKTAKASKKTTRRAPKKTVAAAKTKTGKKTTKTRR